MLDFKEIILHHTFSADRKMLMDWEGIRKFHMSYRLNGTTIIEDPWRADELRARGEYVEPPWQDVGYNFGVEYVNGVMVWHKGRSLDLPGAHCKGHNDIAIGIAIIGNFDVELPTSAQYLKAAELCAACMLAFPRIEINSIYGHREFSEKTCPGENFRVHTVRNIAYQILLNRDHMVLPDIFAA